MTHSFTGKWITDSEFACLAPRNVFHTQLTKVDLPCNEHRNRHILFRKKFICESLCDDAKIYISADDYYKLYINGTFVGQGPAPSYHFQYNYNIIDVSKYLKAGENTIAVHTLYQGLINRVWQSGDQRHGLILDLVADGKTVASSDESFKTAIYSGYTESGICGYQTQFLEKYDSNSAENSFYEQFFDDSSWENAMISKFDDHIMVEQKSSMLVFEKISPVKTSAKDNSVVFDFGSNYVGYLCVKAKGKKGDVITVRCSQELNEDQSVRFDLRANCVYEEEWVLSDGESTLDWFDYKAFRYAELLLPEGVELSDVYMNVRHYPFDLKCALKKELEGDWDIRKIWELCVHTQKYGVQEVIQDCMEREKGFYLGDGCYTALTNMILTKDDSMVRKLIDDAFSSDFISDTLVTCMNCSFMQEIAEYPLMLVFLVLWHYRFTGDREYLEKNYAKVTKLLDAYRRRYEKDGLLRELDKWCVVEWPSNFRHGYDVDIREGRVCHDAHVSINAYYIEAIRTANKMSDILGLSKYRDDESVVSAFYKTFYVEEKKLFRDGENTDHISLVGNSFVFGFGLYNDTECEREILKMIESNGVSSLSFFCVFPILIGLVRTGREDMIISALRENDAWKRMLREDATTTFEGWGKDTKWNTSLFHLTMSYAAAFMADVDLRSIFE